MWSYNPALFQIQKKGEKMKVIGFAGTNGAGKDTVADYVAEKYGYKKITMGDIIRERLKSEGVTEISRKVTGEYQKKFVDEFGIDYWPKETVKEIRKQGWDKVVISGLRYPTDVTSFKEAFQKDFFSVLVDASPEARFERMSSRGRADAPKTIEEFQQQEKYEDDMFHFNDTKKEIDVVVDNGGALDETKKQIDKIVEEKGFN